MLLAPAATLLARIAERVATVLAAHGTPDTVIGDEVQRMQDYRLAGTANRSVVGIMNEFAFLAATYRDEGDQQDLLDLSLCLFKTPCSPLYRKNVSPDRELAALLRSIET